MSAAYDKMVRGLSHRFLPSFRATKVGRESVRKSEEMHFHLPRALARWFNTGFAVEIVRALRLRALRPSGVNEHCLQQILRQHHGRWKIVWSRKCDNVCARCRLYVFITDLLLSSWGQHEAVGVKHLNGSLNQDSSWSCLIQISAHFSLCFLDLFF